MKMLKEIFRTMYALVAGCLAFLAVSLFAVIILDKDRGILGITFTVIVGLLALFVGYQVYRTVKQRGVISFISAVNASPDMDNLNLSDKWVRKVNVEDFVDLINSGKSIFKDGDLRIWGDWKGRKLEKNHRLKRAQYSDAEKLLEITFIDSSQVYIWNPKKIIESDTYLKILEADKVRWRWKSASQQENLFYDYWVENRKIITWTNSNWKGDGMDILLNEPAVLMHKK